MRAHELLDIFQIRPGVVMALVGGGGKTSLMFALAKAAALYHSVITTTTTKIKVPSPEESALTLIAASEADLETQWRAARDRNRHATLAVGTLEYNNKLVGVRPEFVNRLADAGLVDVVIVEADGAKGRSLKAPNDTEPVIPTATTHLIAVIGIDALGKPFSEAVVFRSARARALVGAPPRNVITPEWAAALVTHPGGICKGAPGHARIIFFINKVESPEAETQAKRLAEQIRNRSPWLITAMITGSLFNAAGTGGAQLRLLM